jgi:hypothetical protein
VIISNDFVYIHHPKTGGTFVTKQLEKLSKRLSWFRFEEVPGKKHIGISLIPDEHKDKTIVINVRDVFDHYVSRYKFRYWANSDESQNHLNLELIKRDFPNFPDITFSEFLKIFNTWKYHNLSDLWYSNKRNKVLSRYHIGNNSFMFVRLTQKKALPFFRNMDAMSDEDLCRRFSDIRILRTENLNDDLSDLLEEIGVPKSETRSIRESERILPKRGGRGRAEDWRSYFSDEDVQMIMKQDRLYFRLFPDMTPEEYQSVS